jgi:FtsH-binding integral membrane protein
VFLIAASMFFAMAIYGLTTTKDLSSWGRILFGALIGLVIALVINMFWQNAMFDLFTAIIGVILFSGLTAYDNQMLIKISKNISNKESLRKYSVIGALKLYLDFINLFLSLLRIMGSRR